MEKLKPCPFCGAKETDEDKPLSVFAGFRGSEWTVECERCGANLGWGSYIQQEDAIEAWNRRANDNV